MADLLKYVEKKLDEIRQCQADYETNYEKVEKAGRKEYVVIGGVIVHLDAAQIQQNKILTNQALVQLKEENEKNIAKIISETEHYIEEEKKKIIQSISAAEPVPTQNDRDRMDALIDEYPVIESLQFKADMQMHVNNETVYAFPYYLLAKKNFAKTKENEDMLKELYYKMFPKVQEELNKLPEVEQALKVFRTYIIAFRYPVLQDITDSEAHFERVRMKHELAEMGTIALATKINPAIGSL